MGMKKSIVRKLVSLGKGSILCFFFQAEDGIRDYKVTGVQTCALPILLRNEGECHECVPSSFLLRKSASSWFLLFVGPLACLAPRGGTAPEREVASCCF